MVKKVSRKNCTHTVMARRIIELIDEGHNTPFSMLGYLKISKEKLNYHLKIMVDEGWINKYSRGMYDLTEAGKKRNATLVTEKNKKMIRLENLRFKVPIYGGFEKLMAYVRAPKKSQLRNEVTQYTGKIKNLSVRVFVSAKSKTLEVTCEKKLGGNRFEIYYNAKKQVEDSLIGIMKDGEIKLGLLQPSMKPDWAISHPFAETILDTTESSQIKTKNGTVNRSHGRNADWEVDDIFQAGKVLGMPDMVEDIHKILVKFVPPTEILESKAPPEGIYM